MGAFNFGFGDNFATEPTFPSGKTGGGGDGSTLGTIITGATGVLNTVLGYELQQNQVDHGQYPSIGYDNRTGAPTGQSQVLKDGSTLSSKGTNVDIGGLTTTLSGWLPLIILVAIILLVFKLVAKK